MTLRRFLEDLKSRFDLLHERSIPRYLYGTVPPPKISPEPIHFNHRLVTDCIRALLQILDIHPDYRENGEIRDFWAAVKQAGEKHELFSRYSGDEGLKKELLAFLNSGKS